MNWLLQSYSRDPQESGEKKVDLLKQVPCGEEFSHCKFIRDAYAALESLGVTKDEIKTLSTRSQTATDSLNVLNPEVIESHMDKYQKVLSKRSDLISENASLEVENAQNKTKIVRLKAELKGLREEEAVYEENKDSIENLESLLSQKKTLEVQIVEKTENIESCQEKVHELYRSHGFLQQKLENLKSQRQELTDLREQYSANDLFMSCMHQMAFLWTLSRRTAESMKKSQKS